MLLCSLGLAGMLLAAEVQRSSGSLSKNQNAGCYGIPLLLLCEVSDEFYENPKNFISTMHHVVKEHIVESMSFKRDYHIKYVSRQVIYKMKPV